MYSVVHIHRYRLALCHAGEGVFVNFEDAAGMSLATCCPDCQRRYQNIAKMEKLPSLTIDKVQLRAMSAELKPFS